MAGDFWSHLLYTIPESPYASIVIFDGDKIATKEKRNVLEEIIEKHSRIEKARFRMSDLQYIRKLKQVEQNISCPIYCLKLPEIEDYLDHRPTSKEQAPIVAYNMEHIPQEIEQLFDAVFQMADIK